MIDGGYVEYDRVQARLGTLLLQFARATRQAEVIEGPRLEYLSPLLPPAPSLISYDLWIRRIARIVRIQDQEANVIGSAPCNAQHGKSQHTAADHYWSALRFKVCSKLAGLADYLLAGVDAQDSCGHIEKLIETVCNFNGAYPLCAADERARFVAQVDECLLDLAMRGDAPPYEPLKNEPRTELSVHISLRSGVFRIISNI